MKPKPKHQPNQELEALLQSLGDTPDKIAEYLYQNGYRGQRGDQQRCPLSQALRGRGCKFVAVRITETETERGWCINPPAVTEFVMKFDSAKYPQLEVRA
jgi:hypothetical protein